jgi:hypothetical protein
VDHLGLATIVTIPLFQKKAMLLQLAHLHENTDIFYYQRTVHVLPLRTP